MIVADPPADDLAVADELGRRIAAGALDLPAPPDAAARVIAAASRDDADLGRISELVRRDPALAAQLLRIANSSLFAAPAPIVSLQQAVLRLGLDGLRKAAYVVASRSAMLRVVGREAELRRIYRHSLLAAGWAQELARARRLPVEEAFLCGLLHDVGRAVLWQAAADLVAPDDVVAAAIDRHHAAAGAAVLATWPAGGAVAEVVRRHHDPAPEGAPARMIHLLALADHLAQVAPDQDIAPELPVAALAALALYPEDIDLLWSRRDAVRAFAQELG
ncbi:MAG TPA: HDOD domain-containing protein [Kofleriaceae bacterium]|nr:HDOD domain-containing protein [Kofleriaceae bacterium]